MISAPFRTFRTEHEPGTEMESKARPKAQNALPALSREAGERGQCPELPSLSQAPGPARRPEGRQCSFISVTGGASRGAVSQAKVGMGPESSGKERASPKGFGGSARAFLKMAGIHSSAPACSRILRMRRR